MSGTLIFSPDSKLVAYAAGIGNKQFVIVDGKEGARYDGIMSGSLIFSPDSKHVAYAAEAGNKRFVIVDGKEGTRYDAIGSLIFSPNSKRVAYGAGIGNKRFVIVDGKEGMQYDAIVTFGGARVIFTSFDSLLYLANKGNGIYLVEEKIKVNN
jgi:Tol biopolymer transport system component